MSHIGILNCNPFADEPVLPFFPLPEGKELSFQPDGADELEMCRCVKVSAGKLRFVEMTAGHNPRRPPRFTMWTLSQNNPVDPWTTEYTVGVDTIWAAESYTAAAALPRGQRTPTWSTSFWTRTSSASTCGRPGLWSATSTGWCSRPASFSPRASFTPGSCHSLFAPENTYEDQVS